jgi:hypothetical protein
MQSLFRHRLFMPLLLTIIGALVLLHVLVLFVSPPGFFLDEAATGAHVQAMLQHGTNANGEAWPFYSASLGGGYTTPVYLYPLVAWGALLGTSEVALRAFSQISTLAAIGMLAWAVRFWLGKKIALVAAAVGLALPWGWLQGSLAWDPALVPFFVAISFLCFTLILFSLRRFLRVFALIGLPVFLIGMAYLYPPCRVTAPLIYLIFYGVLLYKRAVSWRMVVITSLGAALIATPLALFMVEPTSLARSQALSVFSGVSLPAGIAEAISNIWLLLNPAFLFFTGDANLRHATGIQGMLGFAAIIPFLATLYFAVKYAVIRKKMTNATLLALICGGGLFAALLGSALTNEGQPHSLRATAAWPFFAILITLGWLALARYASKKLLITAVTIFVLGTAFYAVDLTAFYPARAWSSFDVDVREKIKAGQAPDYPGLALKYYNR